MPKNYKSIISLAVLIFVFVSQGSISAQTSRVDDLRAQINNRTAQIQALEKEIAQYQKSLNATTAQAKTLKGEMDRLNTESKKLAADIKITENKISRTTLNIERLSLEIGDKDENISRRQASLRSALRSLRQMEENSFLEALLAEQSFAQFITEEERLTKLQGQVNENISELRTIRTELTDRKKETESEKRKLVALNNELGDQKKLTDQNRREKDKLLVTTKNTEANYKKLLASRQAQKEAFERELFQFESQLKIAIDQSKLPQKGTKPLNWPLDSVFITQYFGKTIDAVRLYTSGTHNGIDLRAAVGTPVKAAAGGIVKAAGNTDEQPGCYSYGKWVLIEHPNGLSTLYAHLSLIKAVPGQAVVVGQLIGYSGNTGYSTGPHLHLTVYATQGVRIQKYVNSIHCKNVIIPIADPKAYLDPMLYL